MSKQLTYLPKLDALRAIAALLVLFSHYLVDVGGPDFRYGGNGVQIFFVISGFLITTILLAQKNAAKYPKPKLIGNFIVKRALRLFPVYYLLLTALVLLKVFAGLWLCAPGGLAYYYTYTQNIFFYYHNFQSPLLNHTWSLAVEEQFYIFWPFIILFIPRRGEFSLLAFVFLAGVVLKYVFINLIDVPGTVKGVTFIHFDTLGAGALLAWLYHYHRDKLMQVQRKMAFPVFLLVLPASLVMTYYSFSEDLLLPFSLVLMSCALVLLCADPENTLFDFVLGRHFLQEIGKISYGVYLYHKVVPFFFNEVWKKTGLTPITSGWLLFIIYTGIAVGVAALSWRFFESRILKLKEKFDL